MKGNITLAIDVYVLEEAREHMERISHTVEMLLRKEIVRIKKKGKKK